MFKLKECFYGYWFFFAIKKYRNKNPKSRERS